MSSGYFPLHREHDSKGKALHRITIDLQRIIDDASQDARELEASEDAAYDGKNIGYLQIAKELIERCLR